MARCARSNGTDKCTLKRLRPCLTAETTEPTTTPRGGPFNLEAAMSRTWNGIRDLAGALIAKGRSGRRAVLSPDTAHFAAKPTRDDVARLICSWKCAEPCFECRGRANSVVAAYGHNPEPLTRSSEAEVKNTTSPGDLASDGQAPR